jgi:hypothetical protein
MLAGHPRKQQHAMHLSDLGNNQPGGCWERSIIGAIAIYAIVAV